VTAPVSTISLAARLRALRDRLRVWIPERYREGLYRFVAGTTGLLLATRYLSAQEAALWTELGVATVTALFAALYSTTRARLALYAVGVPLGSALVYYGWTCEEQWALLMGAFGQMFGITTAAAKTVQRDSVPAT